MTTLHPLFTQILSIMVPAAPAPTALIWCTACGGSGETHSAYSDNVCGGCQGVGKRPANWRELIR